MENDKMKLYTENGEFVGTLEEIIDQYNTLVIEELEKEFELRRAKLYKVEENEDCQEPDCQEPMMKFRRGCKECYREKYCNSYEKEA